MFELVLSAVVFVATVAASGHAVIYKREPRAAALWIIVIWLVPAAGPILYLLLGVNRVRRRAVAMRGDMVRHRTIPHVISVDSASPETSVAPEPEEFRLLARLVEHVSSRPLLPGNNLAALVNGAEAYPAMLEAIESATESVGLSTYIFDGAGAGERFVEALARSKERRVEVRVLIDAVGANYSWPPVSRSLRSHGIKVALFNPRMVPRWLPAVNLRNHRKILVVDGKIGFTGGFNIKREYWNPESEASAYRDLHFRLSGPVVSHLSEVFADDWQFTTSEALRGEKWFPALPVCDGMLARGVDAGPDENFERLRWVIIGALNAARRSVRVVTPYFLPDAGIVSALNAAALRGVEVDILLPEHSNLAYVHWAMFGQIWQVLERGCRVWLSSGQFDHSKLMIVDEEWAFLGSANWDARSLRLNFEFNVECYSAEFGCQLAQMVRARLSESRLLSLEEVDSRPLPIRLRDGIARLFAPYL
jgi:cardiolipin synthase A/B